MQTYHITNLQAWASVQISLFDCSLGCARGELQRGTALTCVKIPAWPNVRNALLSAQIGCVTAWLSWSSCLINILLGGPQVIAKAEVVQLGRKQNPADALRTWLGTDQAKLSMEELDGLLALLTERKGQAEQHAVAVNGKLLLSFLQHCMCAQPSPC